MALQLACHACGSNFIQDFSLTLGEALRTVAILRGMDIEEAEMREGEKIAKVVRGRVLRSGDQRLVKMIQTLADESWARLQTILAAE